VQSTHEGNHGRAADPRSQRRAEQSWVMMRETALYGQPRFTPDEREHYLALSPLEHEGGAGPSGPSNPKPMLSCNWAIAKAKALFVHV